MRKSTKILSLVLAIVMICSLSSFIMAEDAVVDNSITVLYTNDVHTNIDKPMSYATISALKQSYVDAGKNVILADAGDHIQGTAYGSMDNGATMVQLMNAAKYDIATLGNHEFDYTMAGALATIEAAEYPYVSCNFYNVENGKNTTPVLDSYKVFDFDGVKVAFVGITTPETYTKSTPAYFQDENGNYIYGIAGGTDGADLYAAVQTAIDAAKAEADIIIALGHLGDDPASSPWTSEECIANVSGLNAFIDGHSHSTVEMKEVTDKDGNVVVLTQTGSYFGTIGAMTIAADGTITTTLIKECDLVDEDIKAMQDAWIADVDNQLGTEIAESAIDFRINDAEGSRLIRKYETNLGDLNADAYYYYFNEIEGLDCDLAVMNGGGIRADVNAGKWSYKTAKTVNTFGNVICLVEVTGQDILDALEFGARFTDGGENGGFLHVAGAKYDIDTTVENTVKTDDKNMWIEGPEAYRVTNVEIYNKKTGAYEALDLNKTYTMAGTNYTLRNKGDGFNMLGNTVLVKDYVAVDYLALSAYVQSFKDTDGNGLADLSTANSPLAAYEGYLLNYEDINGSGRISVIVPEEEPVEEPSVEVIVESVQPLWYVTRNINYITRVGFHNFFAGPGPFNPDGPIHVSPAPLPQV